MRGHHKVVLSHTTSVSIDISGSRGDDYKYCCCLRCDAGESSRKLPAFLRNPPSSASAQMRLNFYRKIEWNRFFRNVIPECTESRLSALNATRLRIRLMGSLCTVVPSFKIYLKKNVVKEVSFATETSALYHNYKLEHQRWRTSLRMLTNEIPRFNSKLCLSYGMFV
jgi:hypothetical protein